MRGKTKPEVMIVGAGPVGLASAITLQKRGISFEVAERDDRTGTHSYALALHPSTVNQLNEWGLDGPLRENAVPVRQISFCDHDGPQFELDLTKIKGNEAGLLVVGQDHLEAALLNTLEEAHASIHWSHRLAGLKPEEDGATVELERLVEGMSGYAMAHLEWKIDREISKQVAYVIGADGHFSMVRRRLGIEFPKVAPTQSFAVFEFRTDFDLDNKAWVVFHEGTTNILWPLPNGYCRWGFEIDESSAEQYSRDKDRLFIQVGSHGFRALETEMFYKMVEERARWFSGTVGNFRWRMIVRFEKRLAESFGKNRIWLAGDAGHITAPVGMQSMNVGIYEAHQIATTIADIIEGKAGPEKLEAYGLDRLREWQALMGLSNSFEKRDTTHPFIAERAALMMSCIPASMGTLPAFAEALDLELKEI